MSNAALQYASRIAQSAMQRFMPAQSAWKVAGIKDPSFGIDVADVVTGGVTAVVPVNADVKAGGISIHMKNTSTNEEINAIGIGAGMSAGLGWQVPFLSIDVGKKLDLTDTVTSTASLDFPGGSIGNLWTGPASSGVLEAKSFLNNCALAKVEANFGPNGLSGGIILFSTTPIIQASDLRHVFAFGLVCSVEWAIEITVETGLMNYKITDVKSKRITM